MKSLLQYKISQPEIFLLHISDAYIAIYSTKNKNEVVTEKHANSNFFEYSPNNHEATKIYGFLSLC